MKLVGFDYNDHLVFSLGFLFGVEGLAGNLRESNKVSPWRHFVSPTNSPNVNKHQSSDLQTKKRTQFIRVRLNIQAVRVSPLLLLHIQTLVNKRKPSFDPRTYCLHAALLARTCAHVPKVSGMLPFLWCTCTASPMQKLLLLCVAHLQERCCLEHTSHFQWL